MSKKLNTSAKLFEKALELKMCANAWQEDVMLLGNVSAKEIKEICSDYTKLRLEKGISSMEVE